MPAHRMKVHGCLIILGPVSTSYRNDLQSYNNRQTTAGNKGYVLYVTASANKYNSYDFLCRTSSLPALFSAEFVLK